MRVRLLRSSILVPPREATNRRAEMSGYTVKRVEEVADVLGDYPGEMRLLTADLENEQVAISYRRMPQHTGGKGSYGHYHRTQEELYYVISGRLQFKLDDDVVEAEGGTAIRVAPSTVRTVWNDEPGDAHLLILSTRMADPTVDDAVIVENFWPA
jgi:mannose-6-phosphate isomerase-like protein (cupin superfamily)